VISRDAYDSVEPVIDGGEPLYVQQRRQIDAYRAAWKEAGHAREPRVSVSRSTFAIVDEREVLVEQLKEDTAIAAADTLLLTVPNQLGVDYNAHAIESILRYVAPELGWR
jgi:alkanesulfonate monooxygenase SsuD/methylene tetrahydromethanopterin reductase-like flavin-dependent oxidoreductase (luciferase family)